MPALPRYEIWASHRLNIFNASGGVGWLIRSPKRTVLREGSAYVPRLPAECREQGHQILAYMAIAHAFQQLRNNSLVKLYCESTNEWDRINKGKLLLKDRGCNLLTNAFQSALKATDDMKAISMEGKSHKSPYMYKAFLLALEACRKGREPHDRLSKRAPMDSTCFIVGPAAKSSFNGLSPLI